jgi:glucose/arabinose dehydrogenase
VRLRRTLALAAAVGLVLASCQLGDDPAPGTPADPGEAAPDDADVSPDDADEDVPASDEGDASDDDTATEPDDDQPVDILTEDVVTGLDALWDLAVAGDRVLVTERDTGRLLEVDDDGEVTEVRSFDVDAMGEGGLLGLAVHPGDDTLLYVYLTAADDNRVVRVGLDDPGADPEPIVTGIPKAAVHNGGRIAFGPDDLLYVGTGDAAEPSLSADQDSLAGKILRVTADGEVPDDNPDPASPVYALGLRNVQGLTWDADGTFWAAELGPDVDDEINRIEPGGDYGWPEVTGTPGDDRYEDAAFVAQPPDASWSGAVVLEDGTIPQWEGDLFVAALRGERLWRFEVEDGRIVEADELFGSEFGRLRTAVVGPDGALWLLTTNRDGRGQPRDGDDRIVRVGPA